VAFEPQKATEVYGVEAVAKHLGVTVRTVQLWVKKGMPKSGKRYDLVACELWHRQDQERAGSAEDPDAEAQEEGGSKAFWTRREIKARAETKELELRQRQGELVELVEVEQLFATRAAVYKQAVLGLEPFILALLPDEDRRVKAGEVRRRLREAVESVTRPLPEKFSIAESVADAAAPEPCQ
jgi:phage terminase Nu1 subunit (DNA packaging protein)